MRNTDGKIAIIRKDENNLNGQEGTIYNNKLKQKNTVFLPDQILELGFIVRGEAGGGKTVFLDRLIKESIEANHCVILHNIKGDELEKIDGYCSYYRIEPWEKNTWEIDFLNLCADENEQAENSKIRTLAESFSKVPDDFFDKGAIAVVESLIRCAVKSNKDKNGKVQNTLSQIVDSWHSFNIKDDIKQIDMSDINAIKNTMMKQENEQLLKINEFIKKWNPTSSIYIDPKNEKTSLCVLASVIEIIRKFESISKFWDENAKDKKGNKQIFDISEWIKRKANDDRKVIILSNSSDHGDVANSYISAFINLTTTKLINSAYKPVKEIHFILDEFVQLSSINLNNFMKLPDVGRGKKVRVRIAIQRTSQIKTVWKDFDEKSFASAFQNKIWARYADDDKDNVRHELGKQKTTVYKNSVNHSAQGQSSSSQTETKMDDVANIDELQKELGPIKMMVNGELKTLGVSILCNFSNCKYVSVIKFPFVNMEKRKATIKIKSSVGSSLTSKTDDKKDDKEQIEKEFIQVVNHTIEILPNQPKQEIETEEKSIGSSVVSDVIAESIDHTGVLSAVLKLGEVIEGMENFNKNSNVINSSDEITEDEIENLLKSVSKNKNKEKTR